MSLDEFRVQFAKLLSERSPGGREAIRYRLVHALAASEIPKAMAFLASRREPEAAGLRLELLGRWAQSDARGAMSYARALPNAVERDKAVTIVLQEWVAADAQAAVTWLNSLTPGKEKRQWLEACFGAMGLSDPANALALVDSLAAGPLAKRRLQAVVLGSWAERDAPAAAAALSKLGSQPPTVYGDIASKWATADPTSAIAWATALASPQPRGAATSKALEAWTDVDPQAATSYMVAQPDNHVNAITLGLVLSQWAAQDPSAAMNWVTNLPDASARDRLLAGAVLGCLKTDPLRAAPCFQKLPANVQQQVAPSIAVAMFDQDPSQGLDFVASLPSGAIQTTAVGSLVKQWASYDLSGAVAWMQQLPQGAGRDAAIGGVLTEWTRSDPGAAAAYVQALPMGDNQSQFQRQVAGSWAEQDPRAAAGWVATLPQGKNQDLLTAVVAGDWADRSPVEAANYVAGLGAGGAQQNALMTVLMSWMGNNPGAVRQWLQDFSPGQLRDQAVAYVAQFSGAMGDAETGAKWLDNNFNGAYTKEEESLVQQWLSLDHQSARAWVASSATLPDDVKQRLLNPPPKQ
jgi:hypothetical protein